MNISILRITFTKSLLQGKCRLLLAWSTPLDEDKIVIPPIE